MWLGLDDTDSLDGGCTTLVFHRLLEALPVAHGRPRLTRLWPFAARRTRGNAALSVEIEADDSIVEWLNEYWEENIAPLKGEIAESEHSDRQQYPSDPGMVLFKEQPPESYYFQAVRQETDFFEGGHQWGGSGRIGAAASCAWREHNITFEGIAWRSEERVVSEESLSVVDLMEGTFLCRDPRSERGLVAPRGPCPVMFGVRAISEEIATRATEILIEGSAATIGSRIFATNQASGDHLTGDFVATVSEKKMMRGGHILLNQRFLSFNEGGDVNSVAQWLQIGDKFSCKGLIHEGMVHVEAIKVLTSQERSRPVCECGTRMKSMGKGQGLRCPSCKKTSADSWTITERIPPVSGWAQPPADKRRHLAQDLSNLPK